MNWLRRLFRPKVSLNAEEALALAAYRSRPGIGNEAPLETLRFVVADVETTGLNPFSDQLISIGAVEIAEGRINLGRGFETIFRQEHASTTANILVHGIDGTTQLGGLAPAAAMLQFLDFAGNAPLVGFHADFDRLMIERASRAALAMVPANHWLDLAFLAPSVMPQPGRKVPLGLDEWMEMFGIENFARHNALADALATAQLLQVVLARALDQGVGTLGGLIKREQAQRWLGRQ